MVFEWSGPRNEMITVPELAAEALGSYLSTNLDSRFASTEAGLVEMNALIARRVDYEVKRKAKRVVEPKRLRA